MDSVPSQDRARNPRSGLLACLLIVGVLATAFGGWRLWVWGFGAPEQYFDIGNVRMKLIGEKGADAARRNVEIAREHKATLDPKVLAEAEEELRQAEERKNELVKLWEQQVRRARWSELGYALMGITVGTYCFWTVSRRFRRSSSSNTDISR